MWKLRLKWLLIDLRKWRDLAVSHLREKLGLPFRPTRRNWGKIVEMVEPGEAQLTVEQTLPVDGDQFQQVRLMLAERTPERPWRVSLADLGIEGEPEFPPADDRYPQWQQLLLPWDFRVTAATLNLHRDWQVLLNLHCGLEMPLNMAESLNPDDWEEVPNTSELATSLTGMVGGGVDPLHNALLIVCGAGAGPGRYAQAVRCANFVHYMTTRACVGEQEQFEVALRGMNISLQDAVHAVFNWFDIIPSHSYEWGMFDHRPVWL